MALTKIIGEGIQGISNSANATAINISSDEEVTMPLQPAFSVKPSGDQSNISNAATIVFDSEIYDVGSNFASNTFTAPVTGKYQISVRIYVQNIDSANSYVQVNLTTSNRGYFILFDPDFGQDPVYWTLSFSELVDMDANDTAVVNWYQSGGADQADINSSSLFSGFLAC